MEEERRERIRVRYRTELIEVPLPSGEVNKVLAVTYEAPGLPPRTLFVDKEKASEEEILKLIRLDLERRMATKAKEVEV